MIVKDKDNKIVQAIFYTDWNKDKQYEEKYGVIPPEQLKTRLRVRVVQGRPMPVTRVEKEKEGNSPQVVMVTAGKGKVPALHEEAVAVPKATGTINTTPKEVLIISKYNAKPAVSAKTAPTAKVKVNEVVVEGIKTEAKAAMSTKTAPEERTKINIKLDKPKDTETPKPAPAQPKQEQ